MSTLYDIPLVTLDDEPTTLAPYKGKVILLVNSASQCGLTPQYSGLARLQFKYAEKGFTVIGVPCNQFGEQEPGTAEDIQTFCAAGFGVTFPMLEKTEVNGENRHPLFRELVKTADADGEAGDIKWNFEKFLISPEGEVVARFRPTTEPESAEVIAAIEAHLPA